MHESPGVRQHFLATASHAEIPVGYARIKLLSTNTKPDHLNVSLQKRNTAKIILQLCKDKFKNDICLLEKWGKILFCILNALGVIFQID